MGWNFADGTTDGWTVDPGYLGSTGGGVTGTISASAANPYSGESYSLAVPANLSTPDDNANVSISLCGSPVSLGGYTLSFYVYFTSDGGAPQGLDVMWNALTPNGLVAQGEMSSTYAINADQWYKWSASLSGDADTLVIAFYNYYSGWVGTIYIADIAITGS